MCDIYPLDNTRRRIMGIVVTDDEYSPSIVVKTYDDKPDDNADDDKCSVSRETVCQLMLMERTEPILPKYNKELQQSSPTFVKIGVFSFVEFECKLCSINEA